MNDGSTIGFVYAEESVLWLVVYFLIAVALFAIIAFLAVFYYAGLWAGRRVERWVEERQRREIQSKAPLR